MTANTEDEASLEERVNGFLERNFPQIWMHGGTAAIEDLDPETGEVKLRLGGACSGCGISPMTVQAIKSRMAKEIPEIESVSANADSPGESARSSGSGMGAPSRGKKEESEDSPDVPF